MLGALLWLFDTIIGFLIFVVIVNAILSWLIAFDIINMRNRIVYQIVRTLDAITDPMLRPIRRILPNLGGIDLSPIVLWLLLSFLQVLVHRIVAGMP
jgi:YggT family protein